MSALILDICTPEPNKVSHIIQQHHRTIMKQHTSQMYSRKVLHHKYYKSRTHQIQNEHKNIHTNPPHHTHRDFIYTNQNVIVM